MTRKVTGESAAVAFSLILEISSGVLRGYCVSLQREGAASS